MKFSTASTEEARSLPGPAVVDDGLFLRSGTGVGHSLSKMLRCWREALGRARVGRGNRDRDRVEDMIVSESIIRLSVWFADGKREVKWIGQ